MSKELVEEMSDEDLLGELNGMAWMHDRGPRASELRDEILQRMKQKENRE